MLIYAHGTKGPEKRLFLPLVQWQQPIAAYIASTDQYVIAFVMMSEQKKIRALA